MKCIIEKSDLFPLVEIASNFIEQLHEGDDGAQSILSCLLFVVNDAQVLYVESTDTIRSLRQATDNIFKWTPGRCAIDGRKLLKIVRELPNGPIHLHTTDAKLEIKSGTSRFGLPLLDANLFPQVGAIGNESFRVNLTLEALKGKIFAQNINRILACNGELNQLHLVNGQYRFVSTDEHQLSVVTLAMEKASAHVNTIVLPKPWLEGVRRIFSGSDEIITLWASDSSVTIQTEKKEFSSRLTEGSFPAYESILPDKTFLTTTFNRDDLEPALRRLVSLTDRQSRKIVMDIEQGKIALSLRTWDAYEGDEDIPADHEGKPVKVNFNGRFLLDYLAEVPTGARVHMLMKNQQQGVGFTVEGDDTWQYVIMPMSDAN